MTTVTYAQVFGGGGDLGGGSTGGGGSNGGGGTGLGGPWEVTIEAQGATTRWQGGNAENWSINPQGSYGATMSGYQSGCQVAGTIKYKFKWKTTNTVTPPKTVWVRKYSKAAFGAVFHNSYGSCSNGLGSPVVGDGIHGGTAEGTVYIRKQVTSGEFQVNFEVSARGGNEYGSAYTQVNTSAEVTEKGIRVGRADGGIEEDVDDETIRADTIYSYPDTFDISQPGGVSSGASLGPTNWLLLGVWGVFGETPQTRVSGTTKMETFSSTSGGFTDKHKLTQSGHSVENWTYRASDSLGSATFNYRWKVHNVVENFTGSEVPGENWGWRRVGVAIAAPGTTVGLSATVQEDITMVAKSDFNVSAGISLSFPVAKVSVDNAEVQASWDSEKTITYHKGETISASGQVVTPGVYYALEVGLYCPVKVGTSEVWNRKGEKHLTAPTRHKNAQNVTPIVRTVQIGGGGGGSIGG